MNDLILLQVMSLASATRGFLTLPYCYAQTSSLTNPRPKCKQMQKGSEKRIG